MLAEQHDLKLADSLHENALVELSAADVDEVAGGILPVIAVAFAAGYVAGYVAGRRR